MKIPILMLMLFCACLAHGQIPTPSFARYSSCPTTYSQVDKCPGWYQPTAGTCDYFNECNTGDVGVPSNLFGYQDIVMKGYTGLYTYIDGGDYKEYIGTTIAPLIIGKTYTVSITVSLADSSAIATDGLGALFTTFPVRDSIRIGTLPYTPQVDYSSYGIIYDKVNWVRLTKTFVADSAYTNLYIGAFKPYGSILIDTVGGDSIIMGRYAYYYIGTIGLPDSTIDGDTLSNPPSTPPDTNAAPPIDTTKVIYTFPNAFSPNIDGNNDIFRIISKPGNNYRGYSLRVFNRWGECVFATTTADEGWDGNWKGQPAETGVYFYYADFGLNSEHVIAKGDLTLVR